MNIATSFLSGGIVAAALLFVQFLINRHDVNADKKDEITKAINALGSKIECLEKVIEQRDAISARRSILRFGDELYNNIHHTKEMFDQTLEEIDTYEHFCDNNPGFKNSKTIETTRYIKEEYHRLYSEKKL